MLTDDPDTPGDKHWEIDIGWISQRVPGATENDVPVLDMNYGIGDRWQLTWLLPWTFISDGDGSRNGVGESDFGIKYRFLDQGDKGWKVSFYPQASLVTPFTNSSKRGIVDSGGSVLAPFEVEKDFGEVILNADFGHEFHNDSSEDRWIGGIDLSHDITEKWNAGAEIHVEARTGRLSGSEVVLNVGTTYELSEKVSLLASIGRDLKNSLEPKSSLISYLGIQLRL